VLCHSKPNSLTSRFSLPLAPLAKVSRPQGQNTVYNAWEDLHWADPSTLEVLTLLLDQVPTTRLLAVLTFRPEFTPPWGNRSHLSQLTLSRLGRAQVREMVSQVVEQAARASTSSARTGDNFPSDFPSVRPGHVVRRSVLSDALIEAVVARTDGVPLFVEELTKSVVEARRGQVTGDRAQDAKVGVQHAAPLFQVGIPTTLQDALMARLDRLGMAKELAQVGATPGLEFSYELLHVVSPLDESSLQQSLRQLVDVELLYQRGLLPHATYLFKHALIQDTAYQSLLKSKRQQYHQQIAQVLEKRFTEIKETQPELLAHHYTEAGLVEQAIPYWQQAGERTAQRSAHVEAINHLTRGLELLKTLVDTPERVQQELTLQLALSAALSPVKGYAATEVEATVTRTQELCQRLGETPQLFPVLYRLWLFYLMRGAFQTGRKLAEQMLRLAQSTHEPLHLSTAHTRLGLTWYYLGELTSARPHLEQGIALYDPQQHSRPTFSTYLPRDDPRLEFLSAELGCLAGHRGRVTADRLSSLAGCSICEKGAGRGRAEDGSRGAGFRGQNWGACQRGRAVSAERRIHAPKVQGSKFKVQS